MKWLGNGKYADVLYWKDYLTIIFGMTLYAVGLVGFILPGKIATGGLAGVALITEYATGGVLKLQYTYFVANCLLLLFSLRLLGMHFLMKTIFGVITLTLLLMLTRQFIPTDGFVRNEPLMSGVIGALLCGVGLGLVFHSNGSAGGTDIIIAVINKYKNMTFGRAMLFCDFVIICCSFLVTQDYRTIVQGLIVMGVMTYSIDMAINGFRQSVQYLIISHKYNEIADMINSELKRGCTVLHGTGWYSKEDTKVILLLARQTQAASIVRAVKRIDPNAFISQSVVKGVFGKGFDTIR